MHCSDQGQGSLLIIKKKIGPIVNLDTAKQNALTITGDGEEEEALAPPEREGEGR